MTSTDGASVESMPLEAVDEFVSSGGFADLSPGEAFALISHTVSRPSIGGRPVNLADEGIDVDALEQVLVDRYLDAALPKSVVGADECAWSVRRASDDDVVPALCDASGLPVQAYAEALAQRDAGDPSFMLSLYSRYLDSL